MQRAEARVRGLEYQEGGNNDFVHRLPGGLHYPNLVLSRGLTREDALLKWFYATHTQAERKEITLTLKTADAERTWTFADAFPVSGPARRSTPSGTEHRAPRPSRSPTAG